MPLLVQGARFLLLALRDEPEANVPASKDPEKRKRQLANLKPPIKPGEVRNPTGSNGRIVRQALLNELKPEDFQQFARNAAAQFRACSPFFVTFVTEQIDGSLPKAIDLKQEHSGKVIVEFVNDWRQQGEPE